MDHNDGLLLPIGVLSLETREPIPFDYTTYLRGYIINHFPVNTSFHNHTEDEEDIYDYPLIQYKILENTPVIVGIGWETIEILEEIGKKIQKLHLKNQTFAIDEVSFFVEEKIWGISVEKQNYLLASPTILLNQKNYHKYKIMPNEEKRAFLASNLNSQILSVSKRLGYTVSQRIESSHNLETILTTYKNKKMLGFIGNFQTNFHLPHLLSIGKGVSKGYGCCLALDG